MRSPGSTAKTMTALNSRVVAALCDVEDDYPVTAARVHLNRRHLFAPPSSRILKTLANPPLSPCLSKPLPNLALGSGLVWILTAFMTVTVAVVEITHPAARSMASQASADIRPTQP